MKKKMYEGIYTCYIKKKQDSYKVIKFSLMASKIVVLMAYTASGWDVLYFLALLSENFQDWNRIYIHFT